MTQLYHIPLDAGLSSIVWCSLCDPYAVMMTTDGSLILLEFTLEGSEPKVKISRPPINQVSNQLAPSIILKNDCYGAKIFNQYPL